MNITDSIIRRYFQVGDIITSGGGKTKFEIVDIMSNGVRIQPTEAMTGSILKFALLAAIVANLHEVNPNSIERSVEPILKREGLSDYKNEGYLVGFAKEFERRSNDDFAAAVAPEDVKIYTEGQRKLVQHVRIERDSKLIPNAKKRFREENDGLWCEICRFNQEPSSPYGEAAIEGHHRVPLGTVESVVSQSTANILVLCATCHRMLHRYLLTYQNYAASTADLRRALYPTTGQQDRRYK